MYKNSLVVAYPFVFEKEGDGGYYIHCPDIQGVYTYIDDNDVAYGMLMAQEVLGMTLASIIEDGEPIPKATKINDIACADDDFATLVQVDVEQYFKEEAPIKKTLQIPKWANDLGNRAGVNFSRLLTDAISEIAFKNMIK